MKGVLATQFSSVSQFSPIFKEFGYQVVTDNEGNDITTYPELNMKELLQTRGSVNDWKLESMLAAGINPDIPIHTSFPSRVEAQGAVDSQVAAINASYESESNPESNVEPVNVE